MTELLLPKLGLTMTEATLADWRKHEGDTVHVGDVLFVFETDKSTLEFESPVAGVLTKILVPAGQTVAVLTPVGVIGESTEAVHESVIVEESPAQTAASLDLKLPRGRQYRASPRAKRVAREMGVDLAELAYEGTGPDGRILAADVEATYEMVPAPVSSAGATSAVLVATPLARRVAAAHNVELARIQPHTPDGMIRKADVESSLRQTALVPVRRKTLEPLPEPPPANLVRFNAVRSLTAKRMTESHAAIPQMTLTSEADATELIALRNQINKVVTVMGGTTVSYNAMLVALVGRALSEPESVLLNATMRPDGLLPHKQINMGVAVDTERGLLAPVIQDVTAHDLNWINTTLTTLIERALAGKSTPEDLENPTFTITNLGMYAIDSFTPLIPLPQVAILGVGQIVPKIVANANREVVVRDRMALSLSFDHRAVDGGPAARFLKRVKDLIENPYALSGQQ